MKNGANQTRIPLQEGAKIVVIGGGPAGSFFAIHLLRQARQHGRAFKLILIERRQTAAFSNPLCQTECWKGCNYCAGGLSPKLLDALRALDLSLPEEIIQSRIHSITIQGYWKNIEFDVPPGREMLSVYRGTRPARREDRFYNLDSYLLAEAEKAGAELIQGEVCDVRYSQEGKPIVCYRAEESQNQIEADLAVFAAGVNESTGPHASEGPISEALRRLIPEFQPPRCRRAFIFEFQADPAIPPSLTGTIHFVEYGSKKLRLEMSSLIPKRQFITVVLIGPAIDAVDHRGEHREIMKQFLQLPHIRKLIPGNVELQAACICSPNMVIHSARHPFADRVAAIGDMVTTRLYKDGILSAQQTARTLAEAVLTLGVDEASLQEGYGPVLRRFQKDNRFAAAVFLMHRVFFSSSILSRVLYQAVISERKSTESANRYLEKLLWRIVSGDDRYQDVFFTMIHPATIWLILTGGLLITLRNYLTELFFGLRWEGLGRFTTGVAKERLEAKRRQFRQLIAESHIALPEKLEFERMYTIKIRAPRSKIMEQLGRFGEPNRGYLIPRGVRIQRIAGVPNQVGCVIQYRILSRRFVFHLVLEQIAGGHLAVYRVHDGFAQGGVLIFEIESLMDEICSLSIYVAFNFPRGRNSVTRLGWRLFRALFPAFIHDVLWNHSLCQLKDVVESSFASSYSPPRSGSSQGVFP